jgi:hypothetical protein
LFAIVRYCGQVFGPKVLSDLSPKEFVAVFQDVDAEILKATSETVAQLKLRHVEGDKTVTVDSGSATKGVTFFKPGKRAPTDCEAIGPTDFLFLNYPMLQRIVTQITACFASTSPVPGNIEELVEACFQVKQEGDEWNLYKANEETPVAVCNTFVLGRSNQSLKIPNQRKSISSQQAKLVATPESASLTLKSTSKVPTCVIRGDTFFALKGTTASDCAELQTDDIIVLGGTRFLRCGFALQLQLGKKSVVSAPELVQPPVEEEASKNEDGDSEVDENNSEIDNDEIYDDDDEEEEEATDERARILPPGSDEDDDDEGEGNDADDLDDKDVLEAMFDRLCESEDGKVDLEAFYDSNEHWWERFDKSEKMEELLLNDGRFILVSYSAKKVIKFSSEVDVPDDEKALYDIIEDDNQDNETTDDDEDDDDIDLGEQQAISVEDPSELFEKVKQCIAEFDAKGDGAHIVKALSSAISALSNESIEEWLDPDQHELFRELCAEAGKRVGFREKSLKPGDKLFNTFATSVMKSTRSDLMDKEFQMQSIDTRILVCCKCKKKRNVSAGPFYYRNKGNPEWCCESDGSPVNDCNDPEANDVDTELTLQPYQKTVEFLVHPFSPIERLLVSHRTGAGKTISMVRVLDNFFFDPRPKVVILPTRSTVINFYKDLLKAPNKFIEYASSCAKDAESEVESDLMESKDDKHWEAQLKHMTSCFKMRKFYRKGKPNEMARKDWIKQHPGAPLPGGPIIVLSYARAGGAGVEKRSLYEFRIGNYDERDNPYNNKVVLCDEVHNLTMLKKEFERFRKQSVYLGKKLKTARNTVLVGLTATPVEEKPSDADGLLKVIKGPGKHDTNEGFVSYFGASPKSLFPSVIPDGVPSYSLPESFEVPLTTEMRDKYIGKEKVVKSRLKKKQLPAEGESATSYAESPAEHAKRNRAEQQHHSTLMAPYANSCVYYARTQLEIKTKGGINAAISLTNSTKLHKICDDVLNDWESARNSEEGNNKSIILVDRTCGFEALFLLLRQKAADRVGSLQAKSVLAFPPLFQKSGVPPAWYLQPEETHEKNQTKVLDRFNDLGNSDGNDVAILVVDAREAAEGVSFKSVRTMYLSNPSLNWLQYQQLTGRGVRAFSHNALIEAHRTVKCKMYVGTCPRIAASCANCTVSCNKTTENAGKIWFCKGCSQYFCNKKCKTEGHAKTCAEKPRKIFRSDLDAFPTVDERRQDRLKKKLENSPPLLELEKIAIDRDVLLEVDEINAHAKAFSKVVREARIRKLIQKRQEQEAIAAKLHKEQTEEELSVEIKSLEKKVKERDEQIHTLETGELPKGKCDTCGPDSTEVVPLIECGKDHKFCVPCFVVQFEFGCKSAASVRNDKIKCAHSSCKGGWTFVEALQKIGQFGGDTHQYQELKELYWECQEEQSKRLKSELKEVKVKRIELASASHIDCPDYWERKRLPDFGDLRKKPDAFTNPGVDVTNHRSPNLTVEGETMKDYMQQIVTGTCTLYADHIACMYSSSGISFFYINLPNPFYHSN